MALSAFFLFLMYYTVTPVIMTKCHFPFDQRTRGQKRKRMSICEEEKIEVRFHFLTLHSFISF